MAEERLMGEPVARVNEACLRKLQARMDARDLKDAQKTSEAVKAEKEQAEQVKEAEKFLKSGKPMPGPEVAIDNSMGATSSSSGLNTASPRPTDGPAPVGGQTRRTDGKDSEDSADIAQSQEPTQVRGQKRRGEDDAGARASTSWRIDDVSVNEAWGMNYEQLVSCI